jgi:hypothetical protein
MVLITVSIKMFLLVETKFKTYKLRPDKDEKKLALLDTGIYILNGLIWIHLKFHDL